MGTGNYRRAHKGEVEQQIGVRGHLEKVFIIYPNLAKSTAHVMAMVDPFI
jgi:hypothetical protein